MKEVRVDSTREINIDGEKFAPAKAATNRAMHHAIIQLMRGAEDATITLKIRMELIKYQKQSGEDLQCYREAIYPEIRYEVSEETRSKSNESGKVTDTNDEVYLDHATNRFYIVKTEEADGQITFFEEESQ